MSLLAQESGQTISRALEDFAVRMAYPSVIIPLVVFLLLVVGLPTYLHFRRERMLRHKERMAMIQAGIHPDYPPDDLPEPADARGLKDTGEYRPGE